MQEINEDGKLPKEDEILAGKLPQGGNHEGTINPKQIRLEELDAVRLGSLNVVWVNPETGQSEVAPLATALSTEGELPAEAKQDAQDAADVADMRIEHSIEAGRIHDSYSRDFSVSPLTFEFNDVPTNTEAERIVKCVFSKEDKMWRPEKKDFLYELTDKLPQVYVNGNYEVSITTHQSVSTDNNPDEQYGIGFEIKGLQIDEFDVVTLKCYTKADQEFARKLRSAMDGYKLDGTTIDPNAKKKLAEFEASKGKADEYLTNQTGVETDNAARAAKGKKSMDDGKEALINASSKKAINEAAKSIRGGGVDYEIGSVLKNAASANKEGAQIEVEELSMQIEAVEGQKEAAHADIQKKIEFCEDITNLLDDAIPSQA